MMPMAARAQVALVEDVNSKSAGVQSMDYVTSGKQIRLGKQDTLVLSYLKSCWRETIAGGTVTVGAEQSDVQGGSVQRQKVDCDGDRLILTAQQASQSASFRPSQPNRSQRSHCLVRRHWSRSRAGARS
jgi:hypothetical protein